MEIVGLEARRSDLARGILIARSSSPLDAARQKQLWEALSVAGVTESDSDDEEDLIYSTLDQKPNSRLSCQILLSEELDGLRVTLAPSAAKNIVPA